MGKMKPLTKAKYGWWRVVGTPTLVPGSPYYHVPCRCACGTEALVSQADLRAGRSRSCRPCKNKRVGAASGAARLGKPRGHGDAPTTGRTTEYRAWEGIKKRCNDSNQPAYPNYGGRGITLCERWTTFPPFLADMGRKPHPSYTIERIDNNRGYEPGNCRWATRKEQMRNTRRNTMLTARGQTRCLSAWAEAVGLPPYLVSWRLRHGWTTEEALFTPRAGSPARCWR